MLSHTGHVMTLANSIIGVGILAMPFCFQKCGIFLAIILLVVSNWVTRICCHYIIKSSLLTRRKSFEFLGFHAFGSSGKLLVELCIIGYLLGTCITYFVVVGDIGPQILMKMFALDDSHGHLRTYFMFAVTLLCILPLGMLKNVDSLSAVCTASIGFYVCLVVKIILESETHILANDWTNKVVYWEPAGVLQCLPIFSMALSCQMQLFEVFKSVNNQSVEKLNGIVRDATWLCTFVYIAVGFFGYVAFCTQSFSGNILMNFSPSFGSDVINIGFILSVAFSFPLVIFPCRASIYSLLYRKGHADATGGYIPETRFKTITSFIVGFTLCIALVIPSVELIIGLVGSTIGVAICIMFPAACFRKITKKHPSDGAYTLSGVILVGGFCLMVLGTFANLQAIDEHSSGSHLEKPNLQNILLRPTDIPVIKLEVQDLLKEKLTLAEEKFSNQENPKLPQEEDKKVENLSGLALQQNEKLDKIVISSTVPSADSHPVPVLPVDEPHDNKVVQSVDKVLELQANAQAGNNLASQKDQDKLKEPIGSNVSENTVNAKPQDPLAQPKIPVDSKVQSKNPPSLVSSEMPIISQQAIDKDAIKKDEEIAAEEQKSNKADKATEDELKKTQNELKRTKELLERKVDEIKEELAKQNKETQDLVVEKLGEVVEKVEKIEREVQKQDEHVQPMPVMGKLKPPVKEQKPEDLDNKPLLLGKLTEASMNLNARSQQHSQNSPDSQNEQMPKQNEVYEPLSYKTGELIQHKLNGSNLEQRLPLPLPLLINATRAKSNGKQVPDLNEEQPQIELLKPIQQSEILEPPALPPKNIILPQKSLNTSKIDQPKPEDNIEAIRRDILQLKNSQIPTTDTTANMQNINSQHRIKRSLDFEAIESKLAKQNCLKEPKVETLLQHGASDALDVKIQGIGRDLKSLKEKDNDKS